jgi:hypothetical protein
MISEVKSSRDWPHFGNVGARWKEILDEDSVVADRKEQSLSKDEIEILEDAQEILRNLASQMRAFAFNETVGGYTVRSLGYDPLKASDGLFGLSNSLDTYGKGRRLHRETIAEALRHRREHDLGDIAQINRLIYELRASSLPSRA